MRRHHFIITGLALFVYAVTCIHFDIWRNLDKVLFWARDAQTYRDWILLRPFEVSRAPFFYPVVLALSNLFGNYGTWILQVCMWLVSVNLIAATVYRNTRRESYAIIAAIAFISSLTLQMLTAHAFTESLVVLLLSLLVYFWQTINDKWFMIIFSILAVTKPVFLFPLFGWLAINYKNRWFFICPAIALSVQMIIALAVTGSCMPYAENGFRLYFVAKVLMNLGCGDLDHCRHIAVALSTYGMLKLLAVNLHVTMNTYYNLIAYNMTAVSGFVPESWRYFSFIYTTLYSMVGVVVLFRAIRARSGFLLWMTLYLVAVTGTVFGQGDRYIIVLMPMIIYLACERVHLWR
jgi:hypothetical protein